MHHHVIRFVICAAAAVFLAACEGRVNDDSNFFVLTFRSSTDKANTQANGPSRTPVLTPDGRYLVFESRASNLVPNDTNNRSDIFRKDLSTGEVVLVSVNTTGVQGNGNSFNPAASADGRLVAFESDATNLTQQTESNLFFDIFIRDIEGLTTVRVSVAPEGFQVNGDSTNATLSSDGRFVAFESDATTLVAGDTNGFSDIFVRDRDISADGIYDEALDSTTLRVSVEAPGNPDAVADLLNANGASVNPSIAADGSLIAFASAANDIVIGDTNAASDVFVVDWRAPVPFTEKISVEDPSNPDGVVTDGTNANGNSGGPRITPDGRFVVFLSTADDLIVGDSNSPVVDIFVRDRGLGTTVRASVSTQGGETTRSCFEASISADGRWVVFTSDAPDLVQNDTNSTTDIFLRDVANSTTIRVSVATYGVQSADFFPNANGTVTSDGRFVAFSSAAPNLAPNDTNGVLDILVRGPLY